MSNDMKTINTSKAPTALGPYNQAVQTVGSVLYISGQLGLEPKSMKFVQGVERQTQQAIENISSIVRAAGGGLKDVVKTTVLLKNMDDFEKVNHVYSEAFSDPFPARTTYQVVSLPKGGLVEVEAVAVIGARTSGSIWQY